MHVHSCLSLVEIPDLHVNPPCLRNSNCKYTPMPSDFLFKGPPLPSDSEKLSVVSYGYYLELPNLLTRGYVPAYHELLQGQGYANESLAHS